MKYTYAASAVLLLSWASAAAAPEQLKPMFDLDRAQKTGIIAPMTCEAPPPPPADLSTRIKEETAVINDFGNKVSDLADRASLALVGGSEAAACALSWLRAWAQADALLGIDSKHAAHIRKWEISGYAGSYSRVRPWATESDRGAIEAWLREMGQRVVADFPRDSDLPSRHNNHLYWAIWGVANAAVATEGGALWTWARERFTEVLAEIPADGYLPLELERKQSALGYHTYATAALVLSAELFERNGVPAYSMADGIIHRLVQRSLEGIKDPSVFAERSGYAQDVKPILRGTRLSWLEVYNSRFPTPEAEQLLAQFRPLGHRTYGGSVSDFVRH